MLKDSCYSAYSEWNGRKCRICTAELDGEGVVCSEWKSAEMSGIRIDYAEDQVFGALQERIRMLEIAYKQKETPDINLRRRCGHASVLQFLTAVL